MTDPEDDAYSVMIRAYGLVSEEGEDRMDQYRTAYEKKHGRITTWLEDYEWAMSDPEWEEAMMLTMLGR